MNGSLFDWFIAAYPGVFGTEDGDLVWINYHSATAPLTLARDGYEYHFNTLAGIQRFLGKSRHDVRGQWDAPSKDWYAHQASRKQKSANSDGWTGVMVGFFLHTDEATQLVIPGGESVRDMHMTLAYLGDPAHNPALGRAEVISSLKLAIQAFTRAHGELSAQVAGYGRFTAAPSSDGTPFIALVDCPGLPAFREELVATLARAGTPADVATHGYTPHITLAYLPASDPLPPINVPNITLAFDQLTLAIGDDRYIYSLTPVTIAA